MLTSSGPTQKTRERSAYTHAICQTNIRQTLYTASYTVSSDLEPVTVADLVRVEGEERVSMFSGFAGLKGIA